MMGFMKTYQTNGAFADNYKFLIGSIIPRPIAVISTRNIDGSNNLAPFSFFTAVSAKPMIVCFCPLIRSSDGEFKDTVKAKRVKESPVQMECEFRDMLCYGKVPGSGSLITGEVKRVHIDESVLK